MGDQAVAQPIIIDPSIYTLICWSIPRCVYKTIMTIARTTDQLESLRGAFKWSMESSLSGFMDQFLWSLFVRLSANYSTSNLRSCCPRQPCEYRPRLNSRLQGLLWREKIGRNQWSLAQGQN